MGRYRRKFVGGGVVEGGRKGEIENEELKEKGRGGLEDGIEIEAHLVCYRVFGLFFSPKKDLCLLEFHFFWP